MKKSEILCEPLPVARIGVREKDDEVVVVKDFSCFALMLEEYISLGISSIVIPESSPEKTIIEQMPLMLQKRIKVINDEKEIEIVNRLLHSVRNEFGVTLNEDNNQLSFKGVKREVIKSIEQIHVDFKRMSIGFNHNIQVPVDIDRAVEALHFMRRKVLNSNSRLILAEFEGIFNHYKKVEVTSLQSSVSEAPLDLIYIFDNLLNDQDYMEYSNSISELSTSINRDQVLVRIRDLIRIIKSKNYFATGWDYAIKILNVWAGNLIPDSKAIATMVTNRPLPVLVNLEKSRSKAIETWKSLKMTDLPLRRDGLPYTDEKIAWMPPSTGIDLHAPDSTIMNLGTAGELLKVLNEFIDGNSVGSNHNVVD
jgi:hypothetical protein